MLLVLLVFVFMGSTLTFSVMHPFSGSKWLVFSLLSGILSTYLWKEIGLGITYFLLFLITISFFMTIPVQDRLWQMGIIFASALEIYILLLTLEEVQSSFVNLENEHIKSLDQIKILKEEKQNEKQQSDEYIESFLKEIEKWKEEAKHRKIEKITDEKRLKLAYTEIENLVNQKEELINEAYKANKQAYEISLCLEEMQTHLKKNEAPIFDLERANSQLLCELEKANKENIGSKEKIEILKLEKEELQTKLSYAEASLASQISDNKTLEPSISQSNPIEFEEVQKALKRTEGLYKQLRLQFEEKTKILELTRRELFIMEGKWLTLQKEKEFSEVEQIEFEYIENVLSMQQKIIEDLEEEIFNLEELISRNLPL